MASPEVQARVRAAARAARGLLACAAEARLQLKRVGALTASDVALAQRRGAAQQREGEADELRAMIARLGDAAVFYRDRADARHHASQRLADEAARRVARAAHRSSRASMTSPGLAGARGGIFGSPAAAPSDSDSDGAGAGAGAGAGDEAPPVASPLERLARPTPAPAPAPAPAATLDAQAAADQIIADEVDFATLRLQCDDMQHTVSSLGADDEGATHDTAASGPLRVVDNPAFSSSRIEDYTAGALDDLAALGGFERALGAAALSAAPPPSGLSSVSPALHTLLDVQASNAAIARQREAEARRQAEMRRRRARELADAADTAQAEAAHTAWVSTPEGDESQASLERRLGDRVRALYAHQAHAHQARQHAYHAQQLHAHHVAQLHQHNRHQHYSYEQQMYQQQQPSSSPSWHPAVEVLETAAAASAAAAAAVAISPARVVATNRFAAASGSAQPGVVSSPPTVAAPPAIVAEQAATLDAEAHFRLPPYEPCPPPPPPPPQPPTLPPPTAPPMAARPAASVTASKLRAPQAPPTALQELYGARGLPTVHPPMSAAAAAQSAAATEPLSSAPRRLRFSPQKPPPPLAFAAKVATARATAA